jgi:hypothetical protein
VTEAIDEHYGLSDFSTAVLCERADLLHVFLCIRESAFLFFLDHAWTFDQDSA